MPQSSIHPPRRITSLAAPMGILVLLGAVACTGDSLPTQPDAPAPFRPVSLEPNNFQPNSWAGRPGMPTARRGLVTAAVNGIVYAIGGRGANEVNLATVEAYNTNFMSIAWSTKAPMPARRAWSSGATTINGKIYVAGGLNADANPTRTLYVYNPQTGTWATKAQMPVASYGGASAAINGKLYVVTPAANFTYLHRYDPATNAWTARAQGPAGHYYAVAGAIDGKLYVAGSMNADESPSVALHVYDPATNSWSAKTDVPRHMIGAAGRAIGNKLYYVGGFNLLNIYPDASAFAYNPGTDSWATLPTMLHPRGFLSATAVNGVLYAIGGLRTPDVLTSNQVYTP